ncbi:DUF4407 domain-containing protein [Parafrankia sp. EUN1f]|uniref:DUF4407 domain-containing protein n=1 Tax=Parafrankia sp. EUN1f TaxID=102897 RepID=UPI0001C46C57|nr:DUF4407 domain-containing protein [Parafrankia sp. EUN1f]EFC80611.1 hypothetical protein FrEUN1fDRAFT_6255 [Parafrankia sp. EUN1f]
MQHSPQTSSNPDEEAAPSRGPLRAVGDALVFLAGAQPKFLPPTDRARFVTAGVLMLLTSALATYAGATVVSVGFGTGMVRALPYGLFYALFIFFIDRSVLLTQTSYRYDAEGGVKTTGPGFSVMVRVFIAVCGAIIVGEAILLRIFETSIATTVTEIQQEENGRIMASWDANQEGELAARTADLAAKKRGLDAANSLVEAKTAEVNCQLTGGPSCLVGAGPIYQIKLAELAAATAAVGDATRLRDTAQRGLDEFRATQEKNRAAFARTAASTSGAANDLLMREKAFWRLTMRDRSVLAWRLLLTLLLLGVDLAPLLSKRGLDASPYRRRERVARWRDETSAEVEALQVGHNARERRDLAPAVAARLAARWEDYQMRRDGVEAAVRWTADTADARLAEEEISADRQSRLLELRARHGIVAVPRTPGLPTAQVPAAVPPSAQVPPAAAQPSPTASPRPPADAAEH